MEADSVGCRDKLCGRPGLTRHTDFSHPEQSGGHGPVSWLQSGQTTSFITNQAATGISYTYKERQTDIERQTDTERQTDKERETERQIYIEETYKDRRDRETGWETESLYLAVAW